MNVFRLRSNTNSTIASHGAESKVSVASQRSTATHTPLMAVSDYTPATTPALDAKQQEVFNRLKADIKGLMLPEDHEYYQSEKGFLTDGTLKRYLRARKYDYEASKTMLTNTIKWRRDYRPDEIDPEYIRPEAESGKMYYNGHDINGRPVWIMRPRYQNSKDIDRQVKYIVFCLERGIRLMPDKVENIAIIVDFKDSSITHNPSVATCKKFLDILSNHYPERLGIAFVVKSPWFFFTTFKLISPFIDPVTKAKIKFAYDKDKQTKEDTKAVSNEWVHIQDYIPPERLETEYGGQYDYEFSFDEYWSALLKETGNPYKVIEYK